MSANSLHSGRDILAMCHGTAFQMQSLIFCIHWGTKKWMHINPSVEWHASSFKWFTHVDFNCNNQSWECRPGICVIMTLYLQQKNPLYNIFKTRVSATVSLSFVSSSLLLCSVSLQSCHSPWSLPSLAVLLGSPDAHLLCFTLQMICLSIRSFHRLGKT